MLCPLAYSRANLLIDPSLQLATCVYPIGCWSGLRLFRSRPWELRANVRTTPNGAVGNIVPICQLPVTVGPRAQKNANEENSRKNAKERVGWTLACLLALLFTFQYCPSIIGAHGSSRTEHMIRQELMQDLSSNAGNALRNRRCNGKDYAEAGVTQFANWAGRRQKWSLWLSGMQWWARADPFCIISK